MTHIAGCGTPAPGHPTRRMGVDRQPGACVLSPSPPQAPGPLRRLSFALCLGLTAGMPLLLAGAPPVAAQQAAAVAETPQPPRRGPDLAAASNFGQGWRPDLFDAAINLGVRDYRDAIYWDRVEKDGHLSYGADRDSYPRLMPSVGATMSLTVNNGHPDHDEGLTPSSDEAIAAFAEHARRTVARFSAIRAVEVGNEVNSPNFVAGPMAEAPLADRPLHYLPLLRATATAVRGERRDIRVLGGGLHSIPTAWLRTLFANGAAQYMDALALHPYDTAPEQLVRQVALMRGIPGLEVMPIEITEFGIPNAEAAPAFLLRSHCQMALAGVTRAAWYPLHPRGDGLEPLLTDAALPTPAGYAFNFAQARLAGRPVIDIAPDPFTYGCLYGGGTILLWGAPRDVTLTDGYEAVGLSGAPVLGTRFTLDPTRPLVLLPRRGQPAAERLDQALTLDPQRRLADSFDQYDQRNGGTFQVLAEAADGTATPLEMRDGQGRGGVPWVPYLGHGADPDVRVLADSLYSGGADALVFRHKVAGTGSTALHLLVNPAARSLDGVEVEVRVNDTPVLQRAVPEQMDETLPLELTAGDVLDIRVAPGATVQGDVTAYRFTLSAR